MPEPSSSQDQDLPAAIAAFASMQAERGVDPSQLAECVARLPERLACAIERHPELAPHAAGFLRALAGKPLGGTEPLVQLDLEELLLAFACGRKDPQALETFERQYFPAVMQAARTLSADPAFVDEVCQLVRVKLFASEAPRILEYAGRGSLEGWVRTAALRVGLDALRAASGPETSGQGDLLDNLAGPALSPELELLKARHRAALNAAFEQALLALTDREKTLLRMNAIEGLTIDEIGVMYQAHRSTASRWISAARERLLAETRRRLAETLKLPPHELDSILGALRSQLDVSIGRFLR